MTRSRSISSAALLVATCGALVWPVSVHGQAPQGPQPGSKTKVVRRPVVDLKKQAEQPRPGQVMPGQPAPDAPAPTDPAPAPADAGGEQPPANGAGPADAQAPTAAPVATPAPTPADARPAVDIPDQSSPSATQTPPAGPKPLKPAPVPVAPPPPVRAEPEPVALPAAVEPAAPAARVRPEPEPLPMLNADAGAAPAAPVARPTSGAAPTKPATEPKAEPAPVGAAAIARPGESVEVRVGATEGPADVVEWRAMGEDWSPVATGSTANGRIEVRTGLGAAAMFTLDGQVDVKVLRLSRVRFERREPSGPGMPAEIVVEVNRGEVDIKPKPGLVAGAATAVIRIVTSDKNFATRLPTGVRYDAFTGTRIKVLSAER